MPNRHVLRGELPSTVLQAFSRYTADSLLHQWAWVDSNYRPHAYQI